MPLMFVAVKKGLQIFISFVIIGAFAVVITSDFWRNSNSSALVLVEIEPEKNASSDQLNDLKELMKEKICIENQLSIVYQTLTDQKFHHYLVVLPSPDLVLPEQPPELA